MGTYLGLFLTSFLIGIAMQRILPTKLEENAFSWVLLNSLRREERESAASLIQLVWRFHRKELELEKLEEVNPSLAHRKLEFEEKRYVEKYIKRKRNFERYHQQRAELEQQIGSGAGFCSSGNGKSTKNPVKVSFLNKKSDQSSEQILARIREELVIERQKKPSVG
eukprot:TRINITY_DN17614_c0_g1_i2.p2 TRINITY_DN17614_c0_g1~~TRINITY_DN17614_c0_g1_i2.p2  ORF type:complete len:166 (-),score=7.53 TRINITY_DN17614_c0_g1_i2:138-635(-)